MSKAFVLRGQGLGIVSDKVFLQWPSRAAFDEVMTRELESHGIDRESAEALARWVRVQEVEIVDERAAEPAPGAPNDFVHGTLDAETAARLLAETPAMGGEAAGSPLHFAGTAAVTNPGEPGYVTDPTRK